MRSWRRFWPRESGANGMIDLLRSAFSDVLTVSLGTSIVIVLLLALRSFLSRLRASGRYLIWLLVIARLALPVTLPMLPNGLSLTVALAAQMASADAVDAVQMVEIESLQTLPEAAAAETASDVYSRPGSREHRGGSFPAPGGDDAG